MYAKVIDGIVVKTLSKLPDWYSSEDGSKLQLDWFKENKSIYHVEDEVKTWDSFHQYLKENPINLWKVILDAEGKIKKVIKTFSIENRNLDNVKLDYYEKLKNYRYSHENGGFECQLSTGKTLKIHSDKDSQFNILGILSMSTNGCSDFKTMTGYVSLNKLELQELAARLYSFVQQCYANEKRIMTLIEEADTISLLKLAILEMEKEWPINKIGE